MQTPWPGCVCFFNLLTAITVSGDEFRFASYYGDHMVLQKAPERSVLWGYGAKNATVVVILSGLQNRKNYSTKSDGIWRVTLDPVKAGGPYNISAVQKGGSNPEVKLTDVLFGDVWLCGGQSNMAFTVSQIYNASAELDLVSKFPDVRIFQVALEMSTVELMDLAGVAVAWSVPTANLVGAGNFTHFSAVCWLFGRYLYQTLQYPIGLVESCWGGTPVEAWSSTRPLHTCGVGITRATKSYSYFMTNEIARIEAGPMQNSVLWNAMIHPLLNMTITGAIWYQGESNWNHNRDQYNCTFPSMIDDWRMAFHQGSGGQTALDLPFGFVQLSTYDKVSGRFPEIRWHQTADFGYVPNMRMKRTFMAVAMDLPDAASPWGSIHPRFKRDVAYRLSLGARAVAYGEKGVSHQGPFPSTVRINGTYLLVTYNQNISASYSKNIFEICCSMEKVQCSSLNFFWMPVPMVPQGSATVAMSLGGCLSEHVASLRYAWRDWPCNFKACPIYSADGVLPAPPFVLHRWP